MGGSRPDALCAHRRLAASAALALNTTPSQGTSVSLIRLNVVSMELDGLAALTPRALDDVLDDPAEELDEDFSPTKLWLACGKPAGLS